MKKLLILALILILAFSFTACGNKDDGSNDENSINTGTNGTESNEGGNGTNGDNGSSENGGSGNGNSNTGNDNNNQDSTFEDSNGIIYQLNSDKISYSIVDVSDTFSVSTLVIPSTYNDLPVTSVGKDAFSSCYRLTSVTIPNSVTSIDEYAFHDCSNLKEVYISDMEAWCNISFGNEYANPLYYANNLYLNGELVTELVIPDTVKEIKDYAFYGCYNFTSVIIPDSVTSIGYDTFNHCTALTYVRIPNSVALIGPYAFQYCYKLLEVYNLSDLTITKGSFANGYMGYYALNVYNSLDIPSKQWKTEDGFLFYEDGDTCYLLGYEGDKTEITLPESCNGKNYEIYKYAFYDNDKLTKVTIPNRVTSIGDWAFLGCHELVEVYNLSDLDITAGSYFDHGDVGRYAIGVYNSLDIPSKKWKTEDEFLFYEDGDTCYLLGYTGDKTEVTLPESCNGKNYEIYKYAFYDNDKLTKVTIPNRVTSIGDWAFSGCLNLTNVIIGNSVTSIDDWAFLHCTDLTSVIIGNSVTSIGDSAFSGCDSLTSVTIPNSVTSIGDSAFSGCDSLTSVTIPNSVTSIGVQAFNYCSSLTSITIPDSVTSIGDYAFYDCSSLTSVTIGNGVTSIDSGAFSGCYKLVEVYNLSNLTIIAGSEENGYVGYYALNVYTDTEGQKETFETEDGFLFYEDGDTFYLLGYTGDKTELTLPENCNGKNYEIYKCAFYKNYKLTKVTIPNSVTSIGGSAFAYCYSLTSVTIPDGVAYIENAAFGDCTKLKEVHISDMEAWCNISFGSSSANPLYYAKNLYLNEDLVTELVIPDTVTEIEANAFTRYTSLTSVTIPDSVTSIGIHAFDDCESLTTVYYTGTDEEWTAISIGPANDFLKNATVYYYSKEDPTEEGNFWYYDTEGNIKVW